MAKPDPSPDMPVNAPANTTVLFLPFQRLPKRPEEMLERLANASGIHPGDLRYKLVGRGVNRLTPVLTPEKQRNFVAEMQGMGVPAAIVEEQKIKRRIRLPAARRVEITDADLCFFDRNDNLIFRVDKGVDLLVIAADLAGKRTSKTLLVPGAEREFDSPSFEDVLRKISLGAPAAVFCRVGGKTVEGVIINHSSFQYKSMDEYMQMSAAANFRSLITKAMKRSKSCIADGGFSATTLARISHDENSSSHDLQANLARYTSYMLAAAESGLIRPDSQMAADFTYKLRDQAGDSEEPGPYGEETAPTCGDRLPEPPPAIEHSGIIARLVSTPFEFLYAFFFLLAPFVSVLLQSSDLNHTVLWRTAAGILLLGPGLFMFPYGLLLLTYKRMVENTPTSKVRSLAMGITEVSGQARQYYDLKTAHSGTRCIYFRCRYFRRKGARFSGRTAFLRHMSRDSEMWVLERETSSGRIPFYLEDETGRVVVNPKGALFLVSKVTQTFSGPFGILMPAGMGRSDTRVSEDLIAEGARVYVLGKARPERTGRSVSEKINLELQAIKKDQKRLMKYDTNKNGRVDLDEWEIARNDVENMVYAEMLANGGDKEQVVIGKPGYGLLPFIIADSEEGIIRKLGFRVWLFLAGGMILIITGAQILTTL